MSSYDVALVLDAATLNQGMSGLFANSQAQAKLFRGTQTVGEQGIDSIGWQILAAPTFVLTPPTTAQWNDPHTFVPHGTKPPQPTDQMFQVALSSVSMTFNMQQGPPVPLQFSFTVFAQVTVSGSQIQLGSVAVLPSEASGGATQIMLQIAAGIIYDKVEVLLAGYKIPSSIGVEGLTFTPPVMTVAGGYLAIASNLTATGAPDISGVTWPQQPLGVLLGRNLLTALVNQYGAALVQKMDDASIDYSDSNWSGSYSVKGGISNAGITVDSTLPNIDVTATFSATVDVGVSWWLVPAACALSAATNLL